jgi:hypothetical protein
MILGVVSRIREPESSKMDGLAPGGAVDGSAAGRLVGPAPNDAEARESVRMKAIARVFEPLFVV